ncbi:MAG TPA: alcohol dehydrogenase catalytic domain-containing protein [Gaiellaceae bacterium]|nr:alcohol dehydrogenase catalytic domain-containing protein [Gaiellaceae bacterium]
MRALRLHAAGDLRLREEPTPEAADGELLLRVSAVGLCGSDRHWYLEGEIGDAALAQPLVLGHEFVATVEEGPRRGQRVVCDPAVPCGACPLCLEGRHNLCRDARFAGHSTDGALRTLMTWPERLVHAVPDSLSDEEATLLEPLGVALHAVDLGQVRPGVAVGVLGCGPIGLLLVRVLAAVGAGPVLAFDPVPHRLAAAEASGAIPGHPDGADVVFDCTDADSLGEAVEAVRPGGRVVAVGIPAGDRSSFAASVARRKELTIVLCRRMQPADLPRALRVVTMGRVSLGSLVSDRFALADGAQAFSALADRRGLKVVVDPQRDGTG